MVKKTTHATVLFDLQYLYWAQMCKLFSPGIGFKESIPPAYVVWRTGTSNRVVQAWNRFLGSLKGLQIRALHWEMIHSDTYTEISKDPSRRPPYYVLNRFLIEF
jgi:hypothetical protein